MNYTRVTRERPGVSPQEDFYRQPPCYWCGDPFASTTDHLIPRVRGGSDDPSNLVIACHSCNASKGAKTADEYRTWLAARGLT